MQFPRSSGVLLHPTSLPSKFGIGDFGESAYQFVDFLVESKQSLWQLLPLGPTGYGDSPYQSFSSFAGNPLLISPQKLVDQGLLPETAVQYVPNFPKNEADFGPVIPYKLGLLKQSFETFESKGTAVQREALDVFCNAQSAWLDDFAFFMALKNHHVEQEGGVWNTWPKDIAMRHPEAMQRWAEKLTLEIRFHKYLQFLFFEQWLVLKAYANQNGIQIVGDIPIFVAFDSADVWANRELFFLDEAGNPTVVAGVPPDYFSETGQRWGNPLYNWDKLAKDNYGWWAKRLKMCFVLADIVRIDHFRGFDAYWEIPAEEETAVVGEWIKAPGMAFFEAMKEQLGELPLIAEDLGVITPEVKRLRDTFEFPGMKILQFAFGGEQNSEFLPHTFIANSVVYPGTHDNETVLGWYQNAAYPEQDHIRKYMGINGHDISWDMIRLSHMSVSNMSIIPMQDLMTLDNSARMNFPGKVGGYWRWRFTWESFDTFIRYRLRDMTEIYGRVKAQPTPETNDSL